MTDEQLWNLEWRIWCPQRIEQRYLFIMDIFIVDLWSLEIVARCDGGDPGDEDPGPHLEIDED